MRTRDYKKCLGYSIFHDIIRKNIGYGRIFSKDDLLMPLACTPGISYPPGFTTNSLLEDLVKYKFLYDCKDGKYLLLAIDNRDKLVTRIH